MPNNNYKNEKRYILALTSENFDNFLLKKKLYQMIVYSPMVVFVMLVI